MSRIWLLLLLLPIACCTYNRSISNKPFHRKLSNTQSHSRISDVEEFYRLSNEAFNITGLRQDKTSPHSYQEMYGRFLIPFIRGKHRRKQRVKFFEIGLGCSGGEHYGGGILLWKRVLGREDEIWTADIHGECIENARKSGALDNVNAMTGDQSLGADVRRWVAESGGGFDVIVDDGWHAATHIYTTFEVLWAELKPGGLYFIEDMQINGFGETIDLPLGRRGCLLDIVHGWVSHLILDDASRAVVPAPRGLKWIVCQREACMLAKCEVNDVARCL